jgi:hypothetical protein
MTYRFFLFIVISLLSGMSNAGAQDDLFGKQPRLAARKGLVIAFNGSFDLPAADMAKRFGTSYRIGPSVYYKTRKNWMLGIKTDFIFGNQINEDSLMRNISDEDGNFIGNTGFRVGVGRLERGYMLGLSAGKVFNFSKKNHDNGLLVMTSAGFMQHKISILDKDGEVLALNGDYKKGYDRLTNGLFVEQYVGYNYFANNGLVNFHIGLDITAGFTKGRRDFLYDVKRKDDQSRVDILFGIRGGWYIPVFKRKSEEFFFE